MNIKKILIILDGIVAKKLLDRMISANTKDNHYDIIYLDKTILPLEKPSNFTFYNFDPTSQFKLSPLIQNNFYTEVLVILQNKAETTNVIQNIRSINSKLNITVYDKWEIELNEPNIQYYRAVEILSNGLFETLPNIPVVAQNVGLRQGEIMEVRIPFGSSYAYRYIGSIKQKDWKISAIYRNGKLIDVRPSLVLKPNDIILIIGQPKVLNNVYNRISRNHGQFPMPFGKNIYLFLDLLKQPEYEIMVLVKNAKILTQSLSNSKLIIRITNPSTLSLINKIKEQFDDSSDFDIEIDYYKKHISTLITSDKNKYEIGLLMFGNSLLKYQAITKPLVDLKLPIFKSGYEDIKNIKETLIILNDAKSYEQISPIIFDISTQLKTKIKIYDMDPLGDDHDKDLIEYFESLANVFNQEININQAQKNPIKELKQEENILQILPIKETMFEHQFFRFASLDTDMLSFDIELHNQILIPIIES